jgi:hypothetical protein
MIAIRSTRENAPLKIDQHRLIGRAWEALL